MSKFNRENVLSYFLAFVVIYFGVSEISSPEKWTAFVPKIIASGDMLTYLIVGHGILLLLCGLALIFNFYRRFAAMLLVLMLLDVVWSVYTTSQFGSTFVRDVGLLGMALALSFRN
ncbi:MAG: DoxX family membrane protein [Candidatus Pacebacteria bacterium]|jgi:uncharacterized membrane protein|nr:DoxX family membrane protein [Candidatus Paceibacterota bacterium]